MSATPLQKLSAMTRAFISAYIADPEHNATQAAIKAGYSKKTAQPQSSVLLKNPIVKAEIERRIKELEKESDLSVQWVLANLKTIVDRCMQHEAVMEFDHEAKQELQKQVFVKNGDDPGRWVGVYEFDSSGANKALELIGKHFKMFTDKVQVEFAEGMFERLERARQNANTAL